MCSVWVEFRGGITVSPTLDEVEGKCRSRFSFLLVLNVFMWCNINVSKDKLSRRLWRTSG